MHTLSSKKLKSNQNSFMNQSSSLIMKTHLYLWKLQRNKSILPEKNLAYFQQIDILPYLLKQLGITTKYYAFGNDSHQSGGLVYLNGNYLFLENKGELIFNEIEKTATYIDKTKGKRILFENKTLKCLIFIKKYFLLASLEF